MKCTNIFLRVYERLHCIIYQWQNISIPSTHHHKHNHTERGKFCFNPRSTYIGSTICPPLGFYCIFDRVSYSDPYSDLYSVAIWIRLQNTDPDLDVVYKINYVKLPKFFLQTTKEHYLIGKDIFQFAPFGINLRFRYCSFQVIFL